MMDIVLERPIITEKSMKLTKDGRYTFAVASHASKSQIAKVVADKFQVKVLSVMIVYIKGKTKAQRQFRGVFQTSNIKKAIVQLGKDQKIGLFEEEVKKEEPTVTTVEGGQIIKQKKSLLHGTKVKVEKITDVPAQTTQRKVITGK